MLKWIPSLRHRKVGGKLGRQKVFSSFLIFSNLWILGDLVNIWWIIIVPYIVKTAL